MMPQVQLFKKASACSSHFPSLVGKCDEQAEFSLFLQTKSQIPYLTQQLSANKEQDSAHDCFVVAVSM